MPASESQAHETRERRKRCVALRLAGVAWADIAEQLDYSSPAAACVDYKRAIDVSKAELADTAEGARTLELARLDRMQTAVWARAATGDLRAVETVLKISDRRAKLLGLDAPIQHEVLTVDAVEREIARLRAEMDALDTIPPADADRRP